MVGNLSPLDMANGYFDYNATTPVSEVASKAWLEASATYWQNASSPYREGAIVSRLLEDAQVAIADLLGAEEHERVLFNSGATEANHAVFAHLARTTLGQVVISPVEHPSVSENARHFLGDRLHETPVDRDGRVDLDALDAYLGKHRGRVSLVSVMAANNESGVIQPWQDLPDCCRKHGVPMHCDAAQWIGKLPSQGLGECDFVTGSAHKFGGPKGTGFLLIPEDEHRFCSLLGGPQQGRRRAGTENYPAIASMLAAWQSLEPRLPEYRTRGLEQRQQAESLLQENLPGLQIVGQGAERLWNTLLVIVPDHDNRRWLTRLNRRGFAVSTGSACGSGKENPSRVLQATGYDFDSMKRAIRLSAGWDTTSEDWEALATAMTAVHQELN